jgi:hypothetical protein
MKPCASMLVVILASMATVSHGYDRDTGQPFASRSEVIASHGMAATSQPLATQVALDILKAGGSAVDAAIAANATLGLMEPTGCGIGGDLFAIVWDAETGKLAGLNGSGRSPRALTLDYFREQGLERVPESGPLSVSVPGAVDGWFTLHERFGRLPMAEILAPAIDYAKNGFPVSELIAHYWDSNAQYLLENAEYPGFRETYMPGGKVPAKGDIFRNPRLATTYETIAAGGAEKTCLAEEAPGGCQEGLQEPPLGRRQVLLVPVARAGEGDASGHEIDLHASEADGVDLFGRGSAGHSAQACQELIHSEGFGDVVVRTGVEGVDLVGAVRASGEDEDRRLAGGA